MDVNGLGSDVPTGSPQVVSGDLLSTPQISFCVPDSTASQRPGASIVPSPGRNQRKPLQSKAILFWRQVLVIPSKVRISEKIKFISV